MPPQKSASIIDAAAVQGARRSAPALPGGYARKWRWTHVVANVPDVQLPRLAGLWAAAPAAAVASASSAAARRAVSAAVSPVALALILRGPSALR